MATSASSTIHRNSYFLQSPFSDKSHVLFYSRSRAKFPDTISSSLSISSASTSSSCKASMALTESIIVSEDSISQELAELKLRMKQKKKELKAVMKMKRKADKKEEKKRKRQQKAASMEDSSSSSSSESSCDEMEMEGKCTKTSALAQKCQKDKSVDIRIGFPLWVDGQNEASGRSDICVDMAEGNTVMQSGSVLDVASVIVKDADVPESPSLATISVAKTVDVGSSIEKDISVAKSHDLPDKQLNFGMLNGKTMTMANSLEISSVHEKPVEASCSGTSACSSGTISVCVGGKCRRAGSEKLLDSLRGHVPNNSSIEAVPHKCFGRCKQAINVRVQKENTNPQYSSHVSAEDADLILKQHFGIGSPPSGLPSFNVCPPCQQPATVGSSSEPCIA